MKRSIVAAAAQTGPIGQQDSRKRVISRLIELLREAAGRGAELVVFPELTLTTFFPRWYLTDPAEIDTFFEKEMPGPETLRLFDEAQRLGVGFYLGYAELCEEDGKAHRYNTSILVDQTGRIVGKYRKVHLPGWDRPQPGRDAQHLEKYCFEPGHYGFPVWNFLNASIGMCICNDRRADCRRDASAQRK